MAEPFCTFGALRPWLRLLRSPTSMTSVPPLVMLPPILPISSEIVSLLQVTRSLL
jgi:hypothetical protein